MEGKSDPEARYASKFIESPTIFRSRRRIVGQPTRGRSTEPVKRKGNSATVYVRNIPKKISKMFKSIWYIWYILHSCYVYLFFLRKPLTQYFYLFIFIYFLSFCVLAEMSNMPFVYRSSIFV